LVLPLGASDEETETWALVGCGCRTEDVTAEQLSELGESLASLSLVVEEQREPRDAASHSLANAISEAVPVPVLVTNADGRALSANSNFRLLLLSLFRACTGFFDDAFLLLRERIQVTLQRFQLFDFRGQFRSALIARSSLRITFELLGDLCQTADDLTLIEVD